MKGTPHVPTSCRTRRDRGDKPGRHRHRRPHRCPGQPTRPLPICAARATAAAHWQASQLKTGRIHTSGFDDWGLTIDSAFAMAADGTQPRRLHRVTNAIERNYFAHYAVYQGDVSAGAMAKSLLAARVLGRSPGTSEVTMSAGRC